ncbi:MAG: glucose-6-phosphate isomerase [Bacteroidales bacterium]|nr:glucose-6-phosphate isomerase [Bacteroidales bacterium]MDY4942003.1 glucose-6-phosphate isomerase [Candidatus Limisoma sp.]MDY5999993.1 glucose-6-phosphate isomerase [Candidatus Limisoma sp.]MDY6105048.1 glucose-6-phosphate isomerase [Candidatus Limisoma sp.]
MDSIKFENRNVGGTVSKDAINALQSKAAEAVEKLEQGTGAGNDFLGWLHLPTSLDEALIADIEKTAALLRADCEYVVAIGIGGSYLGAKAVIEALSDSFAALKPANGPRVLFAGQNIGEDYMSELINLLDGKKFGIIVISKSGTTTEPAIAFRLLKEMLEKQEGKAFASKHIVAVTDKARGALRSLADTEGYTSYVIEDNVGGRFSVLTPVGLLPIAVAGFDIRALIDGARAMELATVSPDDNIAVEYAKTRNALYAAGKKIEILVNYNPKLHFLAEWWKQLYGESEGKDHKGIFPASVDNSTDLHSMGQWIQDGERTIFETVISVARQQHEVKIPADADNLDGLNYIAGKRIDQVNKMAELGTVIAHIDGGVPNIHITLPELSEYYLGEIIYFFEKACGISGYILDVNPFNQPGVEAYKKNMFALLEKPGYEEETKAIQAKL